MSNTNEKATIEILAEEFIKRINEAHLNPRAVIMIGTALICSGVDEVEGHKAAMSIADLILEFISREAGKST